MITNNSQNSLQGSWLVRKNKGIGGVLIEISIKIDLDTFFVNTSPLFYSPIPNHIIINGINI